MTKEEMIEQLENTILLIKQNGKDWWDERDIPILEEAIKAMKTEQRWIPVSERLPICEQEVLVCAERRYIGGNTKMIITPAIYEDGTLSEFDSIWSWEDLDYEKWDDENDCGIIPEGWWENRHYNPDEVYNNLIDDHILAWMPLPEPWKEEE